MKDLGKKQKLRGGYYTPKIIAEFLAGWAITSPETEVLEPSCGDGELLEAGTQVLQALGARRESIGESITGVELDEEESRKASNRLKALGISGDRVINEDFFTYCKRHLFGQDLFNTTICERKKFDAVIGNPPFIRYQDFPEEHRQIAFELMVQMDFKPNRLTNIWVPFLVISALLLEKNGRFAMVIPAELFQVKYAAETRKFLSDFFHCLTIITFKKLVFDGIQQEIVLLLGEREGATCEGIRVIELESAKDLDSYRHAEAALAEVKPLDHSQEKWTQYFLTREEIGCLRHFAKHPLLTPSHKVIDVDVGVVTGNNKFFILNEEKARERGIESYVRNIVTRSAHLKGTKFTLEDRIANGNRQYPSNLFYPTDLPFEQLPKPIQAFIEKGEEEGINKGYKCRIRKRWYVVPTVWKPDAFMLRQVHAYPKLILNEGDATCTDTIHRVRFMNGWKGQQVVVAFLNSLTFAFAETKGRSYGGGVLTFEPSEAEDLPLPLVGSEKLDLDEIDRLLRTKGIEAVLEITDQVLLVEGLGLSQKEVKGIKGIWEKLRDRRIRRR